MFDVYIYIDKNKYNNLLRKINNLINYRNNIIFMKDREGIIVMNKNNNEIIVLYQEKTDNIIQLIGEIIISLFGIIMEKRGYLYLHSACVDKAGNGIAIIGARKTGKTTLLSLLLQNKFDFVCNSHIGKKKDVIAIGAPTRMGMRVEKLFNLNESNIMEKIIEHTEIKRRFGADIRHHLYNYKEKKFNIRVNEIRKIYNVKLINKTILKIMLIPIYMPGLEHIKIKKLSKEELTEVLINNKRNGVYSSAKYMNSIFFEGNKYIEYKISNIEAYMVYQNEKNVKEVINFINSKLEDRIE